MCSVQIGLYTAITIRILVKLDSIEMFVVKEITLNLIIKVLQENFGIKLMSALFICCLATFLSFFEG